MRTKTEAEKELTEIVGKYRMASFERREDGCVQMWRFGDGDWTRSPSRQGDPIKMRNCFSTGGNDRTGHMTGKYHSQIFATVLGPSPVLLGSVDMFVAVICRNADGYYVDTGYCRMWKEAIEAQWGVENGARVGSPLFRKDDEGGRTLYFRTNEEVWCHRYGEPTTYWGWCWKQDLKGAVAL